MTKKHHPSNRYERLQIKDEFALANDRKIKTFENRNETRASYVRHEREEATVKELEYALKREPIRQDQE